MPRPPLEWIELERMPTRRPANTLTPWRPLNAIRFPLPGFVPPTVDQTIGSPRSSARTIPASVSRASDPRVPRAAILIALALGIPAGVIYGYPVTCRDGDYQIVQGLAINDFSRQRMDVTHKELLEERDGVKELI